MKNPHNADTIEAIIALNSLSWSKSKISRAFGVDRKKIGRIIAAKKNLDGPIQDSLKRHIGASGPTLETTMMCTNCGKYFTPDPRHKTRQKFCREAECKAASKRQSQLKWTRKNRDYWL